MAWTTPRTWATSEVVTAALMNTHIRDNEQYLKDVLDGVQYQAISPTRGAADAGGPNVIMRKARGSIGSPSIISNGDSLAEVYFQGYDGASYQTAAAILAASDGVPGASDMPGRIQFYTTPDGSASTVERWRITNAGYLQSSVDGAVSTPAISWVSDTNTGIYRSAADNVSVSVGGIEGLRVYATGGTATYVQASSSAGSGFGWVSSSATITGGDTGGGFINFNPAGTTRLSAYESTTLFGQAGAWASVVGSLAVSAAGLVPVVVNRDTNDGTLISLQQSSTEEGTISVSGATVSYLGFMGAHYCQLKPEQAPPPRYAVVAADDSLIPSENPNGPARENEPYIRPAKAADPAVYGVWGGKIKDDAAGSSFGIDGQPVYQIASLGLYRCLACDDGGPIAVGDLLEAAGTRWHARRQADDIVRSSTLGKALEALPSGKGSVACVLYAG